MEVEDIDAHSLQVAVYMLQEGGTWVEQQVYKCENVCAPISLRVHVRNTESEAFFSSQRRYTPHALGRISRRQGSPYWRLLVNLELSAYSTARDKRCYIQ